MTRTKFFACRSNSILNCLRNVTLMMFIKAFNHGNVRDPAVYFRNRRKRKLTADLCLWCDFSQQIFPGLTFAPQIPSPEGLCHRSEILLNTWVGISRKSVGRNPLAQISLMYERTLITLVLLFIKYLASRGRVFQYFERHRASDGVHWNEKAHRRMSNMILEEVSFELQLLRQIP